MTRKELLPKKLVIPIVIAIVICAIGTGGVYAMANALPSFGAQGIDLMRAVLGQQDAAQFENTVLSGIDALHQINAKVFGVTAPVVTWGSSLAPGGLQASQSKLSVAAKLFSWQPPSARPIAGVQGEGQWQSYIQNDKGESVA